MESAHHSLSRPDCNSTADVPSFTLRTVLSAIPFVSDLCGVDVLWFQDNSSEDLHFRFPRRLQNFIRFFWVSWEVFVLLGLDCFHRVAKFCTTTAYRRLLRDSLPSLRILWSAVIRSPEFSAPGTTVPARLLQEAVVIFVKQISPFGCFVKWV